MTRISTYTEKIVHKELSYAVVGCAQRVHSGLGPGFPETVYKNDALSQELMTAGIPFQTEAEFEVAYRGAICGRFRVDMLVDEKIILELKAVEAICKQHEAQTLGYLKAVDVKLALLLNFGERRLNVVRFVK